MCFRFCSVVVVFAETKRSTKQRHELSHPRAFGVSAIAKCTRLLFQGNWNTDITVCQSPIIGNPRWYTSIDKVGMSLTVWCYRAATQHREQQGCVADFLTAFHCRVGCCDPAEFDGCAEHCTSAILHIGPHAISAHSALVIVPSLVATQARRSCAVSSNG
jgi:hypothetical protein